MGFSGIESFLWGFWHWAHLENLGEAKKMLLFVILLSRCVNKCINLKAEMVTKTFFAVHVTLNKTRYFYTVVALYSEIQNENVYVFGKSF